MNRAALSILLFFLAGLPLPAQNSNDQFSEALAQGDLYQSRRKYDLALDAYHKADKLCHHSSGACYLKLASVERKLGDFPSALSDAKRAEKTAADNKTVIYEAHLFRASLLTQMSGKPTDKKLRDAEEELRQALAMDSATPLTQFDLGMVLLKEERDAEGLAEMNAYIANPHADPATALEARRIIANPIRAREPFAPDFSFTTRENEALSNVSLRGKVVLLDFWGTWCPPCRESVPVVRSLQKKYADKAFHIVGISSDDDEAVWSTFIQAQKMTWSEYIDLSGEIQKAFKIDSFPTYIVLDRDGVIRYRRSGFGETTQSELEESIDKALKRKSDPKLAAAVMAEAKGASVSPIEPAKVSASGKPSVVEKTEAESGSPYPGIEAGYVSGSVYKNKTIEMSYEFPPGWIAATPQSLHTFNERTEAAAKSAILEQHPELANSLRVNVPRVIFYASRRGNWDGQHFDLPSIRITAVPTQLDELNPDGFRQLVENRAAATGLKLIGTPIHFRVNQHQFMRADFDHAVGAVHVYQSLVQTLAGDYLLNIELYAYSIEELNQVTESLKAITISDSEP